MWFGTISGSGTVSDRSGILGYKGDALTFATADLGWGSDLLYDLHHNLTTGVWSLGTISLSSLVVTDRFPVGNAFDALTFTTADVGYGPNLFYYLAPTPLSVGAWGGRFLSVVVTDAGATLEFVCAHGNIDQAIRPDPSGRFTASGSYAAEQGVPPRRRPPLTQSARYSGQITGNQMTLTLTLVKSGRQIGPYTVTRGQAAHLVKCN